MCVEGVHRSGLNTAGLGGLMDLEAKGVVGDGQLAARLKTGKRKNEGVKFVTNAATEAVIDRPAAHLDSDRQRMRRNAASATYSGFVTDERRKTMSGR